MTTGDHDAQCDQHDATGEDQESASPDKRDRLHQTTEKGVRITHGNAKKKEPIARSVAISSSDERVLVRWSGAVSISTDFCRESPIQLGSLSNRIETSMRTSADPSAGWPAGTHSGPLRSALRRTFLSTRPGFQRNCAFGKQE